MTGITLIARNRSLAQVLLGAMKFRVLPGPKRRVIAVVDKRQLVLRLDDHTQRKMLLGLFEPEEKAVFERLIRRGDCVCDIGAHVGFFTTLAAQLVGPNGRVVACEAFAPNVLQLSRSVEVNRFENVEVHHVAVAAAKGWVRVGRQSGSDTGSVTAGPRASEDVVALASTSLDDLVRYPGPIRLLKIDVEGFEAQVLAGGSATLARTRAVLIELNRSALASNGVSPEALVETLRFAGFDLLTLIGALSGDVENLPDFVNLLAERSSGNAHNEAFPDKVDTPTSVGLDVRGLS